MEREREGRKGKYRKAATRSSTYRHGEKRTPGNRPENASGQRDGKGKNSDGCKMEVEDKKMEGEGARQKHRKEKKTEWQYKREKGREGDGAEQKNREKRRATGKGVRGNHNSMGKAGGSFHRWKREDGSRRLPASTDGSFHRWKQPRSSEGAGGGAC